MCIIYIFNIVDNEICGYISSLPQDEIVPTRTLLVLNVLHPGLYYIDFAHPMSRRFFLPSRRNFRDIVLICCICCQLPPPNKSPQNCGLKHKNFLY